VVVARFNVEKDGLEYTTELAALCERIGQRRDPLRLDGEIVLARGLVERAVLQYEQSWQDYYQARDAGAEDLPAQPNSAEVRSALDLLRRYQETMLKVETAEAIPRDQVVALIQRIRTLIGAHVPDRSRQAALLQAIGKIDLKY
jgi:hypothetical protein